MLTLSRIRGGWRLAWLVAGLSGLLITAGGCGSKTVSLANLDQFAAQGPGASSVEELVAQATAAVKSHSMSDLQSLTCAQGLTPALHKGINTQYLAITSKPLSGIEFIDDIAVLKSPLLTDWAWYVYQPEKHDPLIAASVAAFEEQIANPPKPGTPPVEMISQPSEPDGAGRPNVRPLGVMRIELQSLGESAGANSLFFIVGKHPQSDAIYIGTILPSTMPAEPTADQPANP